MNTFNEDKKKGEEFEKKALKYFEYKNVRFSNGNFSDYDFILDEETKVEVKSDYKSTYHGCLSIEYKYRGKNSGILKTKSDYYVIFAVDYYKYEVYKIKTKTLLKKCLKHSTIKTGAGDGGYSELYMLPKSKLKKYKIDEVITGSECLFS